MDVVNQLIHLLNKIQFISTGNYNSKYIVLPKAEHLGTYVDKFTTENTLMQQHPVICVLVGALVALLVVTAFLLSIYYMDKKVVEKRTMNGQTVSGASCDEKAITILLSFLLGVLVFFLTIIIGKNVSTPVTVSFKQDVTAHYAPYLKPDAKNQLNQLEQKVAQEYPYLLKAQSGYYLLKQPLNDAHPASLLRINVGDDNATEGTVGKVCAPDVTNSKMYSTGKKLPQLIKNGRIAVESKPGSGYVFYSNNKYHEGNNKILFNNEKQKERVAHNPNNGASWQYGFIPEESEY